MGINDLNPVVRTRIAIKSANDEGEVVFEDHITLSLTINHQVVDGWDGGQFLKDLCQSIAHFDLLLMQG